MQDVTEVLVWYTFKRHDRIEIHCRNLIERRDDRETYRHMLLLFDIDGTLLRRMPPAHRNALCAAARAVYGVQITPEALGTTAGMTDTAIARRSLEQAGVPYSTISALLPEFFAAAASAYDELVGDDLSAYHTPHARATLDWMREHEIALGLVTGNIQRIAWRKLRAAGLDTYFACGGFGDEAEQRNYLPPIAMTRAQQAFGRTFEPSQTYVIGDTPADIACGAAHQFKTVAVATGPVHSIEQLKACNPDFTLENLRELPLLISSPSRVRE
jgi:phosphoglycolate phosphatase-like HAD superfamily hydrolase